MQQQVGGKINKAIDLIDDELNQFDGVSEERGDLIDDGRDETMIDDDGIAMVDGLIVDWF